MRVLPPVVMLMIASVSRGDARHELVEHRGVGRRAAVRRVARMQMQDRGAGARGFDRLLGDLRRASRGR